MGAGCSRSHVVPDAVKANKHPPTSQASARLLEALGGLKVNQQQQPPPPDQHNGEHPNGQPNGKQGDQEEGKVEENPQAQPHTLPSQTSKSQLQPPLPSPPPEEPVSPLLLSPGLEILPLADKPLLKQRQTIRVPSALDLDSADNPPQDSPQPQQESPKEDINNNSQQETHENGKEDTSQRIQSPTHPRIDEHKRRSNSISILPSIDPKGKVLNNTHASEKKSDADLGLWISNKLKTKLKLSRISKAYDRFIPSNFYSEMGKHDIMEVDLGECVLVRKSVLFCDIRNFTGFSSKIGPQDTFKFINAFSRRLLPVIRKYGGYLDKFIGDALVALFPSPSQGVQAGFEILSTLVSYNASRTAKGQVPVHVGIGCHTGTLMLGTVGDNQRMDGIAIGNVISLASQVEVTTKLFGVDFVMTKGTLMGIKEEDKTPFLFRRIGQIKEGTDDSQLTDIYQVCAANSPVAEIKTRFEEGLDLFQKKDFAGSVSIFRECIERFPQDKPSLVLQDRALHFQGCTYLPADWGNGLTYYTEHMTRSSGNNAIGSPSERGFSSPMAGATNLGLMRLVFSAIFHMQGTKKGTLPALLGNSAGLEDDSDDDDDLEVEEGEDNNKKITLPPIGPAAAAAEAHANRKSSLPPLEGKKEKEKEKDLITLVLNGFENHNRVSYLTKAYQRFVPNDFLSYLGKEKIEAVDIGDSMMTNITTMFIEIQGFQPVSKVVSERTLNKLQGMKRFDNDSGPSNTLQPTPSTAQGMQQTPSRKLAHVLSKNTVSLRADLFSFQFFNTINQKLLPIIRQCDGYVDKFFGNAILALFPNLDAATRAGLQIMSAVKDFQNSDADDEKEQRTPAYAHLGMNAGHVILGTVGDDRRMDGTVIGNTVNVAARMLSLTKLYGAKFVTTDRCMSQLANPSSPSNTHATHPSSPSNAHAHAHPHPRPLTPGARAGSSGPLPPIVGSTGSGASSAGSGASSAGSGGLKAPLKFYNHRILDTVRVPGKEEAMTVHEIFDNESPVAKIKTTYEAGVAAFQAHKFEEARKLFEEALLVHPVDVPSQMFVDKCSKFLREGVPANWDGVTVIAVK